MSIVQGVVESIAEGVAVGIANGEGGAAGGDAAAFVALDTVADVETGVGSLTTSHTATLYAYDATDDQYNSFAANAAVWVDDSGGDGWLQYYPAAQNDAHYSNDLTNAWWTASNMTVAKDETGIDGSANGACTLTSTAGNATVIGTAITDAADDQATCWYLKRKTGTGNIDITLDNGGTWATVTLTSNFQKFTVDQASLANPQIGIRVVTSGDAVICGNAEAFLGKTAAEVRGLGPIFTTSAAVATDVSVYRANGNEGGGDCAWYYEGIFGTTFNNLGAAGQHVLNYGTPWASNSYILMKAQSSSTIRNLRGTSASTSDEDTAHKAASLLSEAENRTQLNWNGSWGAENTFVAPPGYDGLLIGAATGGFPCQFRNLRRYDITSYAEGKAIIDGLMA